MVSLQLAFLVRAVNDFTKSSFSNILERAEKKLLTVLASGFGPGASWTLQGSWGGTGTQAWLGGTQWVLRSCLWPEWRRLAHYVSLPFASIILLNPRDNL